MRLHPVGPVALYQLIGLGFSEIVVLEPAFLHDAPQLDTTYRKSLAPLSVREWIFFEVFCAMVLSVAQQVSQVVQAYECSLSEQFEIL